MVKDIEKIVPKKTQVRIERERSQKRFLIISAAVVIVIIIGVISYGLLDQYILTQHKAVAKVENEAITVAQFQKQVSFQRWQMVQQYINTVQTRLLFGDDPTFNNYFQSVMDQISTQLNTPLLLGETVLDIMIDDLVIAQQAKKMSISVSNLEVEEAMQEAFGYFPKGTPTLEPTPQIIPTSTLSPTQFAIISPTPTDPVSFQEPTVPPTEDQFDNTPTPFPTSPLTSTPTPYTLQGYQAQVEQYISQLSDIKFTDDDIKNLIRNQLLRQKVIDMVTADIPTNEERVWARHILVATEGKAEEVIMRLKNNEDFSKLASELSQDTASKTAGGDLGWFGRNRMVKEFEEASFSLEIGDISKPVKTQFGYHIIQVLGHEEVALTSSEIEILRQSKFNEWLSNQKDSMTIEKLDIWENVVPTEPSIPLDLY